MSINILVVSSVLIIKLFGECDLDDVAESLLQSFWLGVDESDDNDIIDAVGLAGVVVVSLVLFKLENKLLKTIKEKVREREREREREEKKNHVELNIHA